MPIYEYECQSCSKSFELLQAISAPAPESCSECGGRLERVPSRPSTNFGRFTSASAERHSKLTVNQQAQKERDRLVEHSKKTGIPLRDLFEDHDHNH
ncbi:MAG TPA: zinc ribbon domain-containing protein [Blastocatellia bacterium]|nr:zinc ribbon domain-containing protein [Blastocatellia bacterium]